eukprot:GHVQ01025555.1.p1 GENE.GHVQ01025555.1~~GHVQ01025555.1.p1  ORF type:complete len:305 (+),score=68.14 GHVQ01025555.1:413-1327(+)
MGNHSSTEIDAEAVRMSSQQQSSNSGWAVLNELLCCAGGGPHRGINKRRQSADSLFDLTKGVDEDDVSVFDRAYDSNDIGMFVQLLSSQHPIDKLEDRMHPWAADPTTVGALAATQLAILASKDSEPEIKDDIRSHGGIPAMVELLASKEEDRQHAAVVALSFLSVDNPNNCMEMFDCGALPFLIEGMKSTKDGMRAATAQTARNIFSLDLKYRSAFLKAGGVGNLVNLLNLPSVAATPSEQALFTQLEAVYHVEDLIMDSGEELPAYVLAVKDAGTVAKLQALTECDYSDLAEAANFLLTRLG